jgi:Reverse transcriptase (RNA-dependent DNA polymerase)
MPFHVDDAIIAGNQIAMVEKSKKDIGTLFTIADLGAAKYFLGLEIVKKSAGI